MKFNEIKSLTKKELAASRPLIREIAWELRSANRHYVRDNLDPTTGGSYLEDFLAKHGEEEAAPIKFFGGTPHCEGEGVKVL